MLCPGLSLVAMLSLALRVGANTAIFSIVDSLLLRTLSVRQPERLVLPDDGPRTNPNWEEIRDRHSHLFAGAVAGSTLVLLIACASRNQLLARTNGRRHEQSGRRAWPIAYGTHATVVEVPPVLAVIGAVAGWRPQTGSCTSTRRRC